MTVASAAEPVRRMHAFKLFRSCPATSSATPGRASKFAPTTPTGMRRADDRQPVVERPALDLPFERRQLREGEQLLAQTGDPTLVERETVERPRIELVLGRSDIRRVRGEDRVLVRGEELGGPPQRSRDHIVGEVWSGRAGGRRLALDDRSRPSAGLRSLGALHGVRTSALEIGHDVLAAHYFAKYSEGRR